jgi:hypothetical protein
MADRSHARHKVLLYKTPPGSLIPDAVFLSFSYFIIPLMFSKEELISQYENYPDEALFNMYMELGSYSTEALDAFHEVINKKGGIEGLLERQQEAVALRSEIARIQNEATAYYQSGKTRDAAIVTISSEIIHPEEVQNIIRKQFSVLAKEDGNQKIKPRTYIGSLLGILVAGTVGGGLWGLQLIYSQKIFFIFFTGLVILCYAIIKFFTKQSKRNRMVFGATVLAVALAVILGQILYGVVGAK